MGACTVRTCKAERCGRDRWAKGLCLKHYQSAIRHGLLNRPPCSVDGCKDPTWTRGLCNKHYLLLRKYGDTQKRFLVEPGSVKNAPCVVCGKMAKGNCTFNKRVYCSKHYNRIRRHGDPMIRLKLGNGDMTQERLRDIRRNASRTYNTTPHGIMRTRFNVAKKRVLAGKEDGTGTINKEQFLVLWNSLECALCGLPLGDDKTIDHIVPLSKGGTNELSNLQMAHMICNQRKNNRVVETQCECN